VTVPDCSTQRAQPRAHVAEVGIHITNPGKQLACLRNIARTLVEIRERIRPAQVMNLRTFGKRPSLFEQSDRVNDALPIGEGTGHHDPALRDNFSAGRHLAHFGPAFLNKSPLPKSPIAISKDRQLITGLGDLPEGFQFLRSQLPFLLPVERQPVEFTHGWHRRSLVDQFLENLRSVSETVLLKMLGSFCETPLNPLTSSVRHSLRQLGSHLLSQVDRRRVRTTPNLLSRRGRRIVLDDLDDDSLFDSSVTGRSTFGVDSASFVIVRSGRGPSRSRR